MKVAVDTDVCVASGVCIHLAPHVFDFDIEGRATVREPGPADRPVAEGPAGAARRAALNCPAGAISIDGVVLR